MLGHFDADWYALSVRVVRFQALNLFVILDCMGRNVEEGDDQEDEQEPDQAPPAIVLVSISQAVLIHCFPPNDPG